jgi:chitodextrinase
MAQRRRGAGGRSVLLGLVIVGALAAAACDDGADLAGAEVTVVAAAQAEAQTQAQPGAGPPAWRAGTRYAVRAQVTFAGLVYECRQAHTAVPSWEPPRTPALWQRPTPAGLAPWTNQTHYVVGSEVTFDGVVYRCRREHVSQPDWTPPRTRSLWAPPNVAPTVAIAAPAAGSHHLPDAAVPLQATIVDPDGPSPFAGTVQWSSNVDGPLCESAGCLVAGLTAGAHTLTVRVTDPAGADASASVAIVINTPPLAQLLSPADGSAWFAGQAIPLRGTASDPEQAVPAAALTWASDRDGPLGTGEAVTAPLSPGTHRVTLTATDAFGDRGTATLSVLVSPLFGPPSALVLEPPDGVGVVAGAPVTLLGLGFDPEDGLLPEASHAWSSDLDGPLGTGNPLAVALSGPGAGGQAARVHRVTLTVTDSDGNSASASILVRVGGP